MAEEGSGMSLALKESEREGGGAMKRGNGSGGWRSTLSGLGASVRRHRRLWIFIGVPLAIVLVIAYAIAFLIDEPLRRYTEAKMNRALKGYTVRIKKLDFHPHGFSLDLKGLTLVQDAHPDPAVADIPYLHASVNWKALLHGRVVGDMLIDRPKVYMNLVQLRKEIADPTPVKERGWQEALEAIYPLKLNEFRVHQADITYQDQGPFKPLRLRSFDFVATNIRNVKSKDRVYPSEFTLEAAVFESGHVRADGRADFLAEPNPTFTGNATLERIELDYFKPITNRYNVTVDKGLLSATGQFEFGSQVRSVELQEATIDGIKVDYIHTPQTAAVEQARVTDADVILTNLSNHQTEGVATVKLQGKFMGSGSALVDGKFHTEKSGPAFELSVRITDVNMPAMNDMFRAYGNFDVASGEFSFFSEMAVRDGAITGYVKPLFKDITVYDPEKDKDKTFTHKVYERVVGGVAKLLKNRPRKEVATKADISGRLDNPNVKPSEVLIRLVQNAFFKAILPGLERETKRERA